MDHYFVFLIAAREGADIAHRLVGSPPAPLDIEMGDDEWLDLCELITIHGTVRDMLPDEQVCLNVCRRLVMLGYLWRLYGDDDHTLDRIVTSLTDDWWALHEAGMSLGFEVTDYFNLLA
jgi:hypothetical protein